MGRPLWWKDGSVFCICCLLLPAQSFSNPSPSGLATIFYCIRFETYLFVASYDSQGHGGGIRSRLHTGGYTSKSKSMSHCHWRSVSKSWCQAPSGAHDQIFITVWQLRSCFVGRPLWREDGYVFFTCCWPLPAQSFSGPSSLGLATIFYCLRSETSLFVSSYD
jgi:hypothetical protein